jgi:hypothetical protein
MREEKHMPQQAMIAMESQPKGFLIGKNSADRSNKIIDAIADIFNFYKSNSKEMPVFDDIRKEGAGDNAFYENEETVFAAPDQTNKVSKGHRLIVISGHSPDKTYLLNRAKIMIGRDKSAHIRIDDKSVSLFHSMICMNANECILKDLNSKNGTLVNGYRVMESQKLRDGDKVKVGSTLFTFIHGDLGHTFRSRRQLRKNYFILGALVFLSILIMSIFFPFNRIKAGVSQPISSIEQRKPDMNHALRGKNMASSTEIGKAQQKLSPATGNPVSLDEKGQQLIEMALQHYIEGNIALSYQMLDKTLLLDLPENSALKTNALAIKDKIAMISNLYQEGRKQYKENKMKQAIDIWSQALRTDQEIAGQTSSYFASQIAAYTGDILYRMAREAIDKKNYAKAKELCSQTLRVQENHEGCLAINNALAQSEKQ